MIFPTHRVYGAAVSHESGRITAGVNTFTDANGKVWSYRGVTAFLLYARWLQGENIDSFISWAAALGANTVRVLGMVGWAGHAFGPGITANWWEQLLPFIDYLGAKKMRIEFTVFADAQIVMPHPEDQRAHLREVVDTIGDRWNCLIEVCNEPFKNGCDPAAIFGASEPRSCPMAYGEYEIKSDQDGSGHWVGTLPVLDYLTAHTPRDPDSWSRKAKDLAEYRDGSGDGQSVNSPLYPGCHLPPVGDEPMGAAEADAVHGRQRSTIADDFFWYHANAELNGAGSTYHCDAGLQATVPPADGDQQACGEAAALAWASIEPEFQTGAYTRGGLSSLPLVWEADYFNEQTGRIYGRILGTRACCVAIKPKAGWQPKAAPGWRITSTVGPMRSLVHLERT